jgi:NodT family efflux transporter outer membrane factor (OMF) lipoprotein
MSSAFSRLFLTRLFLTLAAASLAACAVGPDYAPPKLPPSATGPLLSVAKPAETDKPPPDAWWRLYNDPILDGLLDEAFRVNFDLRAAEANLSAARAVLESARIGQYPSTELSAAGSYGREPTTNEIFELTGRKPDTDWLFDSVLDASYEVDLFGHVRRTIEAKTADAQAVAAARDAVKVTVAAETARAYAEVCTLGEEIAVAEHSLKLVTREENITQARYQAGASSIADVVRAAALVAQTRAALPPLAGRRRAAWFQLAALIGRTPQSAPRDVLDCAAAPRLTAPLPVGDGAALLRRRPDVSEAERSLAAASAGVGIAAADLFPRVSLTGFWGGASDKIDLLDTENALTWGVGPAISWTFPNIAGPLARIRQAKASDAAALAHFNSVVLNALKETEQALSVYTAELDRHADLMLFQEQAVRAFSLTKAQFGVGGASYLDLLTAEQTEVAANAEVAASDEAVAQDQIAVFKSLGGGWETTAR